MIVPIILAALGLPPQAPSPPQAPPSPEDHCGVAAPIDRAGSIHREGRWLPAHWHPGGLVCVWRDPGGEWEQIDLLGPGPVASPQAETDPPPIYCPLRPSPVVRTGTFSDVNLGDLDCHQHADGRWHVKSPVYGWRDPVGYWGDVIAVSSGAVPNNIGQIRARR